MHTCLPLDNIVNAYYSITVKFSFNINMILHQIATIYI